jgi:hypothetical protein
MLDLAMNGWHWSLFCCLFVRHWWSLMIIHDHWWSWYIPAILAAICRPWIPWISINFHLLLGDVPKSWAFLPMISCAGNRRSLITECPNHANYILVIFGYIPYGPWLRWLNPIYPARTWWCSIAMSNYQRLCNLIKTGGYLQFSNITMQNPRFWYPLVNIQKTIENHHV